MDNRQKRKQQKAKARSQRLRETKETNRIKEAESKRRAEYPEIVIQGSGMHEEFLNRLKASVSRIDFSKNGFTAIELEYYRILKAEGARTAANFFFDVMNEMPEGLAGHKNVIAAALFNNLGEQIFAGIPDDVRKRSLPFVNCQLHLRQNKIIIEYEELESFPTAGARIYSSPIKPTIRFGGNEYRVGFFDHAIKRISERIKGDFISYAASGDLYGYFARCVYFEPMTLRDDQPAFAMWDLAYLPGFLQYDVYVKEVLGEENVDWNGGVPYYRLGYCPVVFENGFAVAKTFLIPGFTSTPEFGLILSDTRLSRQRRDALKGIAKGTESHKALMNDEIEHIKWFHDNGIPQVKQMEQEVFRYHKSPKTMISHYPPLVERGKELMSTTDTRPTNDQRK